jgi:hypothetical protein
MGHPHPSHASFRPARLGARGLCSVLPNVPILGESTRELASGQALVERGSAGSTWMFGEEIVYREGMNDGREDVYLCRR